MRARRAIVTGFLAIVAIGTIAAVWRGTSQTDAPQDATVSPVEFLGNFEEGNFARPQTPWEFRFPADHGPHRDFRTEWWYLTGSLNDERGQRLGLQLVLVRLGLTTEPQARSSDWAATEAYAGLFSISDPAGNRLHTRQRASRGALGLAGAGGQPMQVWVEDWRLEQRAIGKRGLDLVARVATDEVALNLQLRNRKPLLDANDIRGQRSEVSALFHFYVQPRLGAEGTLRMGERQTAVDGTVSMEHAWGELPLPGGPVAIDRFTLHLDDGRDLFCVRVHRVDGSGTPETTGLLIDHNNRPLTLSDAEVSLEPTDYWSSKRTGARKHWNGPRSFAWTHHRSGHCR